MGILEQEEENIRTDKTNSENSELTEDEWILLTWYREVSEADQGCIRHIAQALACAL
jgi:hypothetical protein